MLIQYSTKDITVTFTIYKDEMNKGCMLSGELFRASQGGLVGDPRW